MSRCFPTRAQASILAQGRIDCNEIREEPADNKYLSAALEAKADFIISGDHHLKDRKLFEGIRILDPLAFLALAMKNAAHHPERSRGTGPSKSCYTSCKNPSKSPFAKGRL